MKKEKGLMSLKTIQRTGQILMQLKITFESRLLELFFRLVEGLDQLVVGLDAVQSEQLFDASRELKMYDQIS